jgi:hypothetical protein
MKYAAKKNEESKYSRNELLAHSEALFAYKPEVLTGAWLGRTETEFTLEEMKSCITKFLKRKVLE